MGRDRVTYDADQILARLRTDPETDSGRLLDDLRKAPLVPERWLSRLPDGARPEGPLSASQVRALQAASHGLTARLSADLFDIAYDTVRDQLKAARFALRAKNTTHAVAIALRQGLIQ